MNMKIVAAAVVVVLLVASVGYFIIAQDEVEEVDGYTTTRLVVYGNANNDDYLDENDRTFIQRIVDGDAEWDSEKNPYADTNADGTITSEDVNLLNRFLSKEQSIMYYTDFFGNTSYIHYPITGDLGVQYYTGSLILVALGQWDRVTAYGSSINNSVFPDLENKLALGHFREMSAEQIINSGISALIAHDECQTLKAQIENSGTGIDVIPLPTQGGNAPITMVTLGVMLGCEEEAQKYLSYTDEITSYLDEALASIEPEDYATMYLANQTTDTGNITIYDYSSHAGRCFDYIPCNYYLNLENGNDRARVDIETIINDCPEFIILGLTDTSTSTRAEALANYESALETFKATPAYTDEHIIGVSYNVMNTVSFAAEMVLLASKVYPELVDEEYGWEMLQKWYDEFTYLDIDVRQVGGAVYSVDDL